ncbi:transcription antitermination factor NusB [Haliscomenobacter sp.]|uniref:transcription antitermination factor NusB n=1 Tax=Haliscomenobacter sp. TaxID=2717303 RepID=UPI0035948EF9
MLYSLGRDKSLKFDEAMLRYRDKVNKSFELYLFNLLYLIRVAQFSIQDADSRRTKLRPSEDDKKFEAKLAHNPLMESLSRNEGLYRLFKQYKTETFLDEDHIRSFYNELSKKEEYNQYVYNDATTNKDHEEMLLLLYRTLCANELFLELNDDTFAQWEDDESLIIGSIKKTLKALPAEKDFFEAYKPNAEATVDFGELLLRKVHHEDEQLLKVIEPTLRNWDVERVAVIDMILLKMALAELMTFKSIPSKVTLNEFVEIAKNYSTDKSKDFINGILDRLLKQLAEEGKISKEGRGLIGD